MKRTLAKLRAFCWKWHKRLGLSLVVWIIFMSVSGIVINHTHDLLLDKVYVENSWILKNIYNITPTQGKQIRLADNDFVITDKAIYSELTELVAECDDKLIAAQLTQFGAAAVICSNQVKLYSLPDFELIERLDELAGIYTPIEQISTQTCQAELCYQSNKQWYAYDLAELSSQQILALTPFNKNQLPDISIYPKTISYERLILDLHSGAAFSKAGKLIVDAFAVLLILLSSFGAYLWWHAHTNKTKRVKAK